MKQRKMPNPLQDDLHLTKDKTIEENFMTVQGFEDRGRFVPDNLFAGEFPSVQRLATISSEQGLKESLRRQTISAGLGNKLAKTWRGDVYPKSGYSLKAAGVVYTKATKILSGFEDASVIKSSHGFYLAIPTQNAPKKIYGKRVTPGLLEKAKGIRLQYVYRKNDLSLLVAPNMKASYSMKSGNLSGFRKAGRAKSGLASVVMFYLVPQVKMPKLIDFERESKASYKKIMSKILAKWHQK